MKLISWNIWGGRNFAQVLAFLSQQNADIIALQEVRELEENGKRINIAQEVANRLGYEYIYCKAFTTERHTPSYDLGNAILTKNKIKNGRCHFLSTPEMYQGSSVTEPRTAVQVEIEYNQKIYNILCTQLGYSKRSVESDMRNYQFQQLEKIIRENGTILMGDFNALPNSEIVKKLNHTLKNTDTDLQHPTITELKEPGQPQYRIDYIFTSSDIVAKNFQIYSNITASDHFPLSVEIEI